MSETMLVRIKAYDTRRGYTLRRFSYRGIKFHEERGWYRVHPDVADHLRTVRQDHSNPHSPLAFDVCTVSEARDLDAREKEASKIRKDPADAVPLAEARPAYKGIEAGASDEDGEAADAEAEEEPRVQATTKVQAGQARSVSTLAKPKKRRD